jgi:hypothetical protein
MAKKGKKIEDQAQNQPEQTQMEDDQTMEQPDSAYYSEVNRNKRQDEAREEEQPQTIEDDDENRLGGF